MFHSKAQRKYTGIDRANSYVDFVSLQILYTYNMLHLNLSLEFYGIPSVDELTYIIIWSVNN